MKSIGAFLLLLLCSCRDGGWVDPKSATEDVGVPLAGLHDCSRFFDSLQADAIILSWLDDSGSFVDDVAIGNDMIVERLLQDIRDDDFSNRLGAPIGSGVLAIGSGTVSSDGHVLLGRIQHFMVRDNTFFARIDEVLYRVRIDDFINTSREHFYPDGRKY
ncbi:MAG: hypothetical protein K9N23_14890 [Akkermansiaceae bacterium]|nr:hypothetical protein [Akkermansiaceae bacterium]MCF7732972.1 hypothetical protein [Akkermansiaceae bacterium]